MKNASIHLVRISLGFALILGVGLLWLRHIENQKLRETYAREAVKALALDAILIFPTSKQGVTGVRNLPRNEIPCIFSTNEIVRRGDFGSSVSWDNWPSGAMPTCQDFYSSMKRDFDPLNTIPSNCLPVWVFKNSGGPDLSYLVAAADGANTQNLTAAKLPRDRLIRLERHDGLSGYFRTGKFVRGKGLNGVAIELQETTSCDGFTLFKYQTEVKYPRRMRARLEAEKYFVGMK